MGAHAPHYFWHVSRYGLKPPVLVLAARQGKYS